MKDGAAKTKRLKLNEAQKIMFIGVFVTAMILGAATVVIIYMIKLIGYNGKVISTKDESIASFSKVIKDTGACKAPKGTTYTLDEIKKCNPDDIEAKDVSGTLKDGILVNMASNLDLETVARDSLSVCINESTGENYTYKELDEQYENAKSDESKNYYLSMLKTCSALRVIPDALPTAKNDEALLSSLNEIFILSDWAPQSFSPVDNGATSSIEGLSVIPVKVNVDGDAAITLRVISNMEKSIRAFDIETATIEWDGELEGSDQLKLTAQAKAYYTNPVEYQKETKVVRAVEDKKKGSSKK